MRSKPVVSSGTDASFFMLSAFDRPNGNPNQHTSTLVDAVLYVSLDSMVEVALKGGSGQTVEVLVVSTLLLRKATWES